MAADELGGLARNDRDDDKHLHCMIDEKGQRVSERGKVADAVAEVVCLTAR